MNEIACLPGNAARGLLAGSRVDLVFFDFEFRYPDRLDRGARTLKLSSPVALSTLTFLATSAASAASAAPPGGRFLVFECLCSRGAALLGRLLLEQGLPVCDRDLVVVGMNLSKGQEAVPIATVIDEGRL